MTTPTEEVQVLLDAASSAQDALDQARRIKVWPMTPERLPVYTGRIALEHAISDLRASAEALDHGEDQARPVRPVRR
jgi:hypothetical protein